LASRLFRGRRAAALSATLSAGAALLAVMAGAAHAQPLDPEGENEVDELVVSGARQMRGAVIGDIAPEVVLGPREVRAYGAASVAELLDALAPQTGSGQGGGRPVVLIDGGRVSGFAEIRDLPTEAIARVDILPEEVSLKYGYPAEQKVVNIVLRRRFRAQLAEATAQAPTQGAGETFAGHGGVLHILRGQRLTVDARLSRTAPILESDRDVAGGDGAFRSLQPRSLDMTVNAVVARTLAPGVSGSLNGTFEQSETLARLGPAPSGARALTRKTDTGDAQVAASANGAFHGWQWSYTGQLARTTARSATERALDGPADLQTTRAETTTAQSDMVLNRALLKLPAGRITSTLTFRASDVALDSDSLRLGVARSSDLDRSVGELRGSLDLPLLAAGQGAGAWLGKLSANLNAGLQHLSDFGDLHTLGAGLSWTPLKPLRILAAYSRTDQAPAIDQLGDPAEAAPQVRVFDLRTGQTALVTRITGGSPDLKGGRRDVLKIGVTYKPFDKLNLTVQADYVSSRTRDAVVAFPSASTEVEDAFPERFVRDASGALVQVDARPVNFARQARDQLRWGFTWSRPIGPQPTPDQIAAFRRRLQQERAARAAQNGAAPGQASPDQRPPPPGEGPTAQAARPPSDGGPRRYGGGPGAGPGRGRGMGFAGFGGGRRSGVLQIGLYHTIAFRDDVLIRPGLPALDLLDGAALGAGGGSPRHQVDLQANLSRGGMGLAMNARWRSATHVDGSAAGGFAAEDLRFSDLTTVSLRLFADLGLQPFARDHRWLRGARLTLAVDNLFDARQHVQTSGGVTPVSYQPDLLDPVGRSVRLTVRKLFF
jgi:hypothetical protein